MSSFSPIDPTLLGQTAEGVVKLCDDQLARARELADELRALKDAPDDSLTRDAVLGRFDELTQAVQLSIHFPQVMAVTHPDATVRDAAKTCEPKLDTFQTAFYMDADIAHVFERFAAKKETLSTADAKLLEDTLRDYRRNGLKLDAAGQTHLKELNEEITKLSQQFEVNLAETTLFIEVTPEQLAGLPESFITAHQPEANGKIRITTNYPDLIPFLKYAKDRSAARELYFLSNNRAADKNLPILERLLALRKEKATLLGYPTWADYVLEVRMAKSSARVRSFLDDLHRDLKDKAQEEFVAIREMYQTLGGNPDEGVPLSDSSYLFDHLAKERFALDSQKLSEYFEIGSVKAGILEISSRLYGITFKKRTDVPVWHEDVEVLEIFDTDNQLLARAYLDLYPRPDKYKHMAMFDIRHTKRMPDGSRLVPFAGLICNFPKPGAAPALLSHGDVTTFFHEFGHLLHDLLSTSPLATFAGTTVARDFVEAPSQMFEEWAWTRETLDLFAAHYQTGEKLPEDLLNAALAERNFGEAIHTERQLFLADLDYTYHTREPGFDTTQVMNELRAKYTPFKPLPDTHFQAAFGHLVGYDAGYYGYQWALSIAQDLFTRFKQEGIMNPKTAQDYREAILSPGGCDDEEKLVERFLGRPGNSDAYKKFLGITK